ncbi:MAG: hypothetical protein GY856_27025 [bacterium]|nr:hypothetical protein [bacterium]
MVQAREFAKSLAEQLAQEITNRGVEFSDIEERLGWKPKSVGRILRSAGKMSAEALYAIGTATAADLAALVGRALEDARSSGVAAAVRDSEAPPERSKGMWDTSAFVRETCDEYDARHRRARPQDTQELIARLRTSVENIEAEFAHGGELTEEDIEDVENVEERLTAVLNKHRKKRGK